MEYSHSLQKMVLKYYSSEIPSIFIGIGMPFLLILFSMHYLLGDSNLSYLILVAAILFSFTVFLTIGFKIFGDVFRPAAKEHLLYLEEFECIYKLKMTNPKKGDFVNKLNSKYSNILQDTPTTKALKNSFWNSESCYSLIEENSKKFEQK